MQKREKCALCGEEKPASQGMKPQEVKRMALQAATKEAQAEAFRLRMRSWKNLLGQFGYDQAAVMFQIEWGHKVPKNFPRELKRAA